MNFINHFLMMNRPEDFAEAKKNADGERIHVQAVLIEANQPLTAIPIDKNWGRTPIALFVTGTGKVRDLIIKASRLRRFNVRVYIPADSIENLTAIRILSSLGVSTSIIFQKNQKLWDELIDLMAYSLLGLVNHGTIEPFSYLASNYENCKYIDFSAVYFNDPAKYLHVNKDGRMALTNEDLEAESFISLNLDDIDNLEQNEDYIERLNSRRNYFLETDGCAYCPGWRVCLGKFSNGTPKNHGCREFSTELMEIVEKYRKLKSKNAEVWQP